MKVIPFLAVVLLLTGCSSLPSWMPFSGKSEEKAVEKAAFAKCPPADVKRAFALQKVLRKMESGVTTIKDLESLGKPVRSVQLVRPGGREMAVNFYQAGVVGCPYMSANELHMPVIMDREGVVMGFGLNTLQELHGQGWRIKEAVWPWQSYDYSYLPIK